MDIYFTKSSNKWMTNKIKLEDGRYAYKCSHNNCPHSRMMHKPHHIEYNSSIYSKYCTYHYKTVGNVSNPIIIY
jgi:hypothetical protein